MNPKLASVFLIYLTVCVILAEGADEIGLGTSTDPEVQGWLEYFGSNIRKGTEGVVEFSKPYAQKIGTSANGLARTVNNKYHDFISWLQSEDTSDASRVNEARDWLRERGSTIRRNTIEVVEASKPYVEKVGKSAKELASGAQQKYNNLKTWISSDEPSDGSHLNEARDWIKQSGSTIKKGTADVVDASKPYLEKIGTKAKGLASSVQRKYEDLKTRMSSDESNNSPHAGTSTGRRE